MRKEADLILDLLYRELGKLDSTAEWWAKDSPPYIAVISERKEVEEALIWFEEIAKDA